MRGSPMFTDLAGTSAGHRRIGAATCILHLAAAPAFTIMAALTTGDQSSAAICSAGGGSMLSGMTPMYLLMAIVHLGAWLELFKRRRG